MSKDVTLVVCAKVTTPLRAGSVAGFKCVNCGEQLQVTAVGLARIKAGGLALCNPCGLSAGRQALDSGKLAGTEITAEVASALWQLGKMN